MKVYVVSTTWGGPIDPTAYKVFFSEDAAALYCKEQQAERGFHWEFEEFEVEE